MDVAERAPGTHRHLLSGSAALVVGAGVQALTGALFWLVAANTADRDDVGVATALFTAVLFLAYLAGLGLQVSLARYAPDRDHDSHATFAWGVVAASGAAVVVSSAFLVVADIEAVDAVIALHPVGGPVLFVAGAVGATLTLLVDVRWMTVRRWGLVLARITAVGVLRFPLLVLPDGGRPAVALFAAAVAPLIVTGIGGVVVMPRISGLRHRLRPFPAQARATVRYSAVNYLSTLAERAPQFAFPVIVLLEVDPDTNAAFYVAWGITGIALYVPTAIGQALLAEGGKDGVDLAGQVRVALAATMALMAAGALVATLGRDLITTVYGDEYARGARVLPALVAGTVPWAATAVFLTEARVRHRHLATVTITVTLAVAILVPAAVLVPTEGIDGAARAFVLGNLVTAAVATATHLVRFSPSGTGATSPA